MHDFKYKNNDLYCEAVKVKDIARKVGTPFYLYSHKTILDHYRKLQDAFRPINADIFYSMKANSSLAICRALVKQGAGLDIVSGGELYKALLVGCEPKKIVYASVGKTQQEIEMAVRKKILFFNVESIPELELINNIAGESDVAASVALRINPDVEPGTHKYITTGKLTNKFGIDFDTARQILRNEARFANIRFKGIHMHIGSQIITSRPYVLAIKKVVDFINELNSRGPRNIEYFNIGGGLGIIYNEEKPQTANEFADAVIPVLKGTGLKIILEPGRFIVGNAGILVTKVLYLKKTPLKNFVIVDGGMNDLIRPSLYGAHHEILPLRGTRDACPPKLEERRGKGRGSAKRSEASPKGTNKMDVVGPICESADFFAKDRILSKVQEGALLAIMSAGAYGFSMASNYNSRLRPAEVMVRGNKPSVIRKRESYKDLIRNEIVV